jgi:hypothetical protein
MAHCSSGLAALDRSHPPKRAIPSILYVMSICATLTLCFVDKFVRSPHASRVPPKR